MPLPHTKPEVYPLSLLPFCPPSPSSLASLFLCFPPSGTVSPVLVLWSQSSHAAQGLSYVCYIDLLSTQCATSPYSDLFTPANTFCFLSTSQLQNVQYLWSSLLFLVRVFWELLHTVFVQSCTRGSSPQVVILPPGSFYTVCNGNLCAWDSTCSSAGV